MKDIRQTADLTASMLAGRGIGKYSFSVSESEKSEFNAEQGSFSLFRTVMNNNITATVFRDSKTGTITGNDISPEGIEKTVDTAIASAESAVADEAYDIAPKEESECFKAGCYEPDMDAFFARVEELLDTVHREYPNIMIVNVIASHTRSHVIYRNSNETEFERFAGSYEVGLEISGNDGENTTGLDYTGVETADLSAPFIELGSIRRHLEDTQSSLKTVPLGDKFEGTVIFTPDSLGMFLWMTMDNYITAGVILDGTSLWLDKVGEKVADECITVRLDPTDPRIVCGENYTGDGFKTEPVTVIDRGVLTGHMLNLYAANKTGRPVMKNTSGSVIMEAGTSSLEEMIASIDRGLIVGGFSGGQPGTNGDFSGVAKNSFLIENGKIAGAVTETMINGNLGEIFTHVKAVSKEVVCDGSSVLPYLAASGIVISGK